jgi:hypothetical protein
VPDDRNTDSVKILAIIEGFEVVQSDCASRIYLSVLKGGCSGNIRCGIHRSMICFRVVIVFIIDIEVRSRKTMKIQI